MSLQSQVINIQSFNNSNPPFQALGGEILTYRMIVTPRIRKCLHLYWYVTINSRNITRVIYFKIRRISIN